MDFITAEAFITNLHPRAKRAHGGKLLDYKTNSLGRGGKSAITELPAGAPFASWHEQLGGRAVIEYHCFASRIEGLARRSRARADEGPTGGAPAPARKLGESSDFPSDSAFEIGLLGDALVKFGRALDAIVAFVALGRKQLRDLIHAARPVLASGARRVIDGLANLEPRREGDMSSINKMRCGIIDPRIILPVPSRDRISKYPPGEPGALRVWPLKAAVVVANADTASRAHTIVCNRPSRRTVRY